MFEIKLGIEPQADPFLQSPRSACSLCGGSLTGGNRDQVFQAGPGRNPDLPVEPGIDNRSDAGYGKGSLGQVGAEDDLGFLGGKKGLLLLFQGKVTVKGNHFQTLPGKGLKGAPDFGQTRKEDQEGSLQTPGYQETNRRMDLRGQVFLIGERMVFHLHGENRPGLFRTGQSDK